jgi:hypothetical protein
MALQSCVECGRKISSEAAVCPGCGLPNKPVSTQKPEALTESGGGSGWVWFSAICGVLIVVFFLIGLSDDSTTKVDTDPEKQESRRKLVAELTGIGVIDSVDCKPVTSQMWAGQSFNAVRFDEKQSFTAMALQYCRVEMVERGTVYDLEILDVRSGRVIGEISGINGRLTLK